VYLMCQSDLGIIGKIILELDFGQRWLMTSEVEQRPMLITGCYSLHGSQSVN